MLSDAPRTCTSHMLAVSRPPRIATVSMFRALHRKGRCAS